MGSGKRRNSTVRVAFEWILHIFDPFPSVCALTHLFSDPALPSGDRGRTVIVTIYYGTYARCHGISHTLFHLLLTPAL